MSVLDNFVFSFSLLFCQNVLSQHLMSRNNFDLMRRRLGLPFPPCPYMPYSDIGILPYNDVCYSGQGVYYPEQPFGVMPCREFIGNAHEPPESVDHDAPVPGFGGFCDYSIIDVQLAEEEDEIGESPFISDMGFGGDTLILALNPLLETADSNVALLMYTKVRNI